jgi:quercetin dioxygenase-like cupin family protein
MISASGALFARFIMAITSVGKVGMPPKATAPTQLGSLVDAGREIIFDLGDPRFELLTPSEESADCVMKGTLPAGVSVPLHGHAGIESFHMPSGEAKVLAQTTAGPKWKTLWPGDLAHIPGGVEHSWRKRSWVAWYPNNALLAAKPSILIQSRYNAFQGILFHPH